MVMQWFDYPAALIPTSLIFQNLLGWKKSICLQYGLIFLSQQEANQNKQQSWLVGNLLML